jgi:integrase
VRAPTAQQLIAEVARGRALGQKIDQLTPDLLATQAIDPLNGLILARLAPLARPVYTLLAWTHCRWSELESLDLTDLFAGRPLRIRATKGGRDRSVPTIAHLSPSHWTGLDVNAPLSIICYDTLRQCIRRARRQAGIPHLPGAQFDTHLPRHLWASWSAAHDVSLERIAHGLSHHQLSSTRSYIHSELVTFCREHSL